MIRKIKLRLTDGTEKEFSFLATGATAFRYKQCFHQDLMVVLSKMGNEDGKDVDGGIGDKLAYIMNAQAEGKQMNQLSIDGYLEWADQFDGAELFLHMEDFVSLYLGNRKTGSVPKKQAAQLSVK